MCIRDRYHYERPVRESLMELWMQPQKGARQRLVSFELDIEPAAQVFSYADSFGNAVYHSPMSRGRGHSCTGSVSTAERAMIVRPSCGWGTSKW